MLYESSYWKEPLIDSAKLFDEYKSYAELDEQSLVRIEKDIFVGFYSIRKLLDTIKVTDELKTKKYTLQWHKHLGTDVTFINNHKIDELYDLGAPNKENRDLWFIASRLIHSYIFSICESENGGFLGVYFTSDSDKNKKLYYLSVDEIIAIFEEVGNNYVTEFSWKKDSESGAETLSAK